MPTTFAWMICLVFIRQNVQDETYKPAVQIEFRRWMRRRARAATRDAGGGVAFVADNKKLRPSNDHSRRGTAPVPAVGGTTTTMRASFVRRQPAGARWSKGPIIATAAVAAAGMLSVRVVTTAKRHSPDAVSHIPKHPKCATCSTTQKTKNYNAYMSDVNR